MAFTVLPKTNITFDDIFSLSSTTINDAPETFNTTEDLLTLSCVSFRLRKDKKSSGFISLTNDTKTLASNITDEDREAARVIKNFFSGKILMQKLRGAQLSKFREDLSKFLHNEYATSANSYTYPKDMVGLAYKLPYFYEHDQLLITEVFESEYSDLKKVRTSSTIKKLTYIRSLDQYQKRSPATRYWFKDQLGNRVVIAVEKNNPLIPAWEVLIKNPIMVDANFTERSYDTLNFYQAPGGWKIVF